MHEKWAVNEYLTVVVPVSYSSCTGGSRREGQRSRKVPLYQWRIGESEAVKTGPTASWAVWLG